MKKLLNYKNLFNLSFGFYVLASVLEVALEEPVTATTSEIITILVASMILIFLVGALFRRFLFPKGAPTKAEIRKIKVAYLAITVLAIG